jgi:predicted nucleic-acid-binding protein
MTGLDTTIIVRYLMQDDPKLSPVATRILEVDLSADDQGYLSTVVVAELAWVLKRVYRLKAAQIAAVLEQLLRTDALVVEAEGDVFAALTLARKGLGSFPDAFIGLLVARAGCATTLTFNRGAAGLPGFSVPV